MSKKTFIILIIAATVLLIVSYCQPWMGSKETPSEQKAASISLDNEKKLTNAIPPPPEGAASASSGAGFLPTQMEDPKKFEVYQKSLGELAQCLNLKVGTLDPQTELNFDYFNSVISLDLGDIVAQKEQWSAIDIRMKAGEIRRIFIENSFSGSESPRSLKYYSLSPGGEQKELPLSKEQMENPSDALIASLESDGEVIARSVSRYIFYQNGDDLLLIERNGMIYSFELPHGGKTFICTGADSSQSMKCQCR